MQETEKVKILQTEREALKKRSKEISKERERTGQDYAEVVCPECGGRQLVHDYERAELVCQNCGLVIDEDFIDRVRNGGPLTTTSGSSGPGWGLP